MWILSLSTWKVGNAGSISILLNTKNTWDLWSKSSTGPREWLRSWRSWCLGRFWNLHLIKYPKTHGHPWATPLAHPTRDFGLKDLRNFFSKIIHSAFPLIFCGLLFKLDFSQHVSSPLWTLQFLFFFLCFTGIWRKKSPAWKMGKLFSLNKYLLRAGFGSDGEFISRECKTSSIWKKGFISPTWLPCFWGEQSHKFPQFPHPMSFEAGKSYPILGMSWNEIKKPPGNSVKSSKEMLDVQMLPWPLKSVINDILSTKRTHRKVWVGNGSSLCLISRSQIFFFFSSQTVFAGKYFYFQDYLSL